LRFRIPRCLEKKLSHNSQGLLLPVSTILPGKFRVLV
jgi:hypothetical protein